jgi:hypothetical protein
MHHISVKPGPPSKSTSNVDAAKRWLADTGYAGEPVTLVALQEVPALYARGRRKCDRMESCMAGRPWMRRKRFRAVTILYRHKLICVRKDGKHKGTNNHERA